jgi:hypothetical protein
MNDTLPSPDVAVLSQRLTRLRTLTIVSLALNGLILLFILAGIVAHHHHRHHGNFGGWRDRGGDFDRGGFRHDFHHHDGGDRGGWDRSDRRFGADRGDSDRGNFDRGGFDRGGFGGGNFAGSGFGDHPRMGPMGAPPAPPDPAKMTDGILNHLTQALTLTDDEKAKIKPIVAAQVAQFQKEAEDRRQEMQKEMADGRAKIRALLNPDQQKTLDQLPVPGEKPADTSTAAK